MNIFIAGANGGIGRQAVEQALKAGHRVTALVRNPAKLQLMHPNLKIITGDIMLFESFADEMKGQQIVLSALGVSGGLFSDKPTTLYSQGNANLLKAMEQHGVKRIICISASALEISPVIPWYVRLVARYVIQKLLKHMYADLRRMEIIIKESSADWTIIRPPQLNNKPLTGNYRTAVNRFLKNCLQVSRADVSHYMVSNLINKEIYQATVEIAY
ncbi:NAD(P)-dependent oxidoreductase [Mucilaginibacter ginsenosidivorax]|uniref:SDR family oxidoreductase n=1 Tax=Mucilaginibacter ginsenosidivorax TaxID=862126 RepID=A0A5B8W6X7_9SPHI|nr:SDR family oxidoreductase [Mucilaginibacter ginsenosidivorax]QEC78685.1 SDR family oxidoreductase [Mucilaginibacter ginsenosidivorax]